MTKQTGACYLIFGPMFSCKTTELLRRLTRPLDSGSNKKILYINHSFDNRNDVNNFENVSTHNPLIGKIPEKLYTIKTDKLININVEEYDIIGIDEGQFFDDILIVKEWVMKYNKIVHVVSLSGDFNLNILGNVYKLIPISNKITLLNALCQECSKNGVITDAITSCKKNTNDNNHIGGKDKYIPLCLNCYKFKNL